MAIQGQKIELTKNHLFNVAGVALLGLGFYLAVKSSFAPKPETRDAVIAAAQRIPPARNGDHSSAPPRFPRAP